MKLPGLISRMQQDFRKYDKSVIDIVRHGNALGVASADVHNRQAVMDALEKHGVFAQAIQGPAQWQMTLLPLASCKKRPAYCGKSHLELTVTTDE